MHGQDRTGCVSELDRGGERDREIPGAPGNPKEFPNGLLPTFPSPMPTASIQCSASPGFVEWLAQSGGSLAITTYQAGKVALVGWNGREITLVLRQFDKPMGLACQQERMALASRHQVWLLANAPLLAPEYLIEQPGRYDALFLPRAAYFTGDLNVHDLAFTRDGLVVVNTRFSCLSRLSQEFSFTPGWRPPFISQIVPEDRCHLNGLAVRDGQAAFVTALGASDVVGGWRDNKAAGGVVLDIDSGEIVLRGLSMPHSPRWHEGHLWLLNSGTGELCRADLARGTWTAVCGLAGYLRGLCFCGPFALVGMCQIRERHIFGGLPIQQRHDRLLCGVAVIDLRRGEEVGRLEFTSGVQEIYDVQFLPGLRRPTILNLDREAARQAFTAPEFSYWLRPSSLVEDHSGQ